ncbi:hypothetical protein FXO37_28266 [Capsicum annuum]|nr:hypothetical protein FXO37_28266 [Capsicum annuum]
MFLLLYTDGEESNPPAEKGAIKDDYSNTIPESAQVELDAILEGLAAPVDELPLEVVPPSEEIMDQHPISYSQLPPDILDAVTMAHHVAKNPSNRTRTKFKVFKSPYITKFSYTSKVIEDQTGEMIPKFSFDGFLISDVFPRGVIEVYKQWVEEGLLKFHAKKKMNNDHYKAKSSTIGVQDIDFVVTYVRSKD